MLWEVGANSTRPEYLSPSLHSHPPFKHLPYRECEIRKLVEFLRYFPHKTTGTGKVTVFNSTAGLDLGDSQVPAGGLTAPSSLGSPHPVESISVQHLTFSVGMLKRRRTNHSHLQVSPGHFWKGCHQTCQNQLTV